METCPPRSIPGKTPPVRAGLSSFASVLATVAMACESAPPDRTVATSTQTTVVTPKVTWPAAAQADARARAALGEPKRASELLARSPVPVLAPTSVTFERPSFVVGTEYYALTGRVSGTTIAIQGTRAARHYDGIAPVTGDRSLRGVPGFVSINEGIRTTSWIENGVAYSVDVECQDPGEDRCTSDAFVIDVVEHLAFAGGGSR